MKTDWRAYIHSNPEILTGKPVVKGTRLAVDFILGLFANGWTEQEVLESYPTLTPQALQAVFAFAAECMRRTSSTFSFVLNRRRPGKQENICCDCLK
jgi:uncharacterized protein (DUF433 family)